MRTAAQACPTPSAAATALPSQSESWDESRSARVTKPLVTSSNPNTQNGPRDDLPRAVLPGSGGRIRTYDLWVMRRMAPVPCLPSGPSASRLSRANRPWRPTSSNRSDRCPQRPYYRFYYGRQWIIADNSARRPAHGDDLARSEAVWVSRRRCRPSGTWGAASPDRADQRSNEGLPTGSRSLSVSRQQRRSLPGCERQRAQARRGRDSRLHADGG